jgi:hypothetical protein
VVRGHRPLRAQLGWSLLAGVAFAFFWYSREEGIWLVPSLLLLLGPAVVQVLRPGQPGRWPRLGLLALPVLLFAGAGWLLRSVNARYYGAPVSVDVKDSSFPRAYGALLRLTPAQPNPGIPVARETRLRAYAVSPAFALLQPYLEGPVGDRWTQVSQGELKLATPDQEIHGGWFQWALREAAAQAGQYRNAATADAYWAQVAAEINAACGAHRLPAGPARAGLFPRWDDSLWAPFRRSLFGAARVTGQFSDFSMQGPPSAGTPAQFQLFTQVTHESPGPSLASPTRRTHARAMIRQLYGWGGGPATLLALLAAGLTAQRAWRRRSHIRETAMLLALGGGALALMIVAALVDVTSFSALHAMYLAPATPLLLAAWVLAPLWAWPRPPGPTSD